MEPRSGTQSLARSIRLLRTLAARGEIGWRLSDVAAACGLDKGTAHRILGALVKDRLVQQRPADKRYLPGPLLFELGLALQGQHAFQAAAEAQLARWARRLEANALLLLRSGDEYVCSVRAGTSRIPGLMIDRGTRRPLLSSVGGVAIVQELPPHEARAVVDNNLEQEMARFGPGRLEALQNMRERSARLGFGINLGDVVHEIHSFAIALHGPDGRPFAALCLIGTAERFPESRIPEIHRELKEMAQVLECSAADTLFGPGSVEPGTSGAAAPGAGASRHPAAR